MSQKPDEKTLKNTLFKELKELLNQYKTHFTKDQLQEYIYIASRHILEIKDIQIEYNAEFCKMWINYAKNNLNPNAFFAAYDIDKSKIEAWKEEYPEFKRTALLIPDYSIALTNRILNQVLKDKEADFKSTIQILLKMLDIQYRTIKDMGILREEGAALSKAKKTSNAIGVTISDDEIKELDSFFNEDINNE
jgi:hypothetical protein